MIYFIRSQRTGLVKIGTTTCLPNRIAMLRKDDSSDLDVLGLADGGHAEEKSLHHRFSHLRLHGEWFLEQPDLLDFIEANTVPRGDYPEGPTTSFRAEPELVEAIDGLAASERHSRSVTINILLQQALAAIGRWPPKKSK